jgi:site-specific recombinase XerD
MLSDPIFRMMRASWSVALAAEGSALNTVTTYCRGVDSLARWLDVEHPGVGVLDVQRTHIRGWVAETSRRASTGSARSWLAGIRHFFKWLVEEDERGDDPSAKVKMPPPNAVTTPTINRDDISKMLDTCIGNGFTARRDKAIIYVFADGGLRLSEVADLGQADTDTRTRMLFVTGKGANKSGPRRRAIALGVKATQALDRYQRARLKHPFAASPQLWLGAGTRATLSGAGIKAMLNRRAALVGVKLHPHMFRHTWASAFRRNGGSEGDLMTMGGWTSRAMLDRYGCAEAEDRAQEAYLRISLGDRL